MRMLPSLALAAAALCLLAGCGQKGPLVRPTRTPTTRVVIRTPAATPPPAAPQEPRPPTDAPHP